MPQISSIGEKLDIGESDVGTGIGENRNIHWREKPGVIGRTRNPDRWFETNKRILQPLCSKLREPETSPAQLSNHSLPPRAKNMTFS